MNRLDRVMDTRDYEKYLIEQAENKAKIYTQLTAHKAEVDNRPICPDCKAVMVKTHIELEDGSGWFTGWACECEYEPTGGV